MRKLLVAYYASLASTIFQSLFEIVKDAKNARGLGREKAALEALVLFFISAI